MKTIAITELTEIEAIIRKCPYCTVGITDLEGNPYVVPMNFAYRDGIIYLHSGPEVYAPAGGMQLQHEVAQRDMPRKRPFHRRYG